MHMQRLLTAGLILATTACMTDPHTTLPDDTNSVRYRSVIINADKCLRKDMSVGDCSSVKVEDRQRVDEMRGVIGAPFRAVSQDPDSVMQKQSYDKLSAFWSRIPVGYGCEFTMQGVFPDGTKDPNDIKNYNFDNLDKLIGAVRTAYRVPLWTAAYGLGDGKGASGKSSCKYGNAGMSDEGKAVAEQLGTPIPKSDKEIARWAQAVRRVTKYYNRELPKKFKENGLCNPQGGAAKDWKCSPSLFNIEFGRDPNGAGGFTKATQETWLKSYKAFAKELREEFPYPGNDVLLFGPSVVIRSSAEASNTKVGAPNRSWLYAFIDYVVKEKLPLSVLSFEVEAASPVEARDIAKSVRNYADAKGLKDENGKPIRLFVTDLRLNEANVPATLRQDHARFSTFQGAFYAATKILWQGYIYGATVGRVVRFPTQDANVVPPVELAQTALNSDLLWFDQPKEFADAGTLKPGAWHSFWFNRDFLGGGGGELDGCTKAGGCTDVAASKRAKGMVQVIQGPDAAGLSGKVQKGDEVSGLIALATRENCVSGDVDQLGQPIDCVSGDTPFPDVTDNRQRVIRAMVANLNVDAPAAKEILIHKLRIEVNGLPSDVKTVGYRWARMDGTAPSWLSFIFPEQGVADVHDGSFHLQRDVAVPSMHYYEFLY
ncbi:MAG: hypothetical protein KC502_07285 [Myxococcales bacterium]|nr:hypothetical protein [Myxococcales bacterium]